MKSVSIAQFKSLFAALALLIISITVPASAAANTLTVSGPASVSSDAGSVIITITAQLGSTPVPVVDSHVMYDPAKLEFLSIDYSGSPFTSDSPDSTKGSNFYKISRYTTTQPYPTGTAFIARLTFRPKAGSGTTQITVDRPQSGFYTELGDDVLSGVVAHTLTFTTPAPPAPSTPAPATPTTPSKPSTTTTTPKPTATSQQPTTTTTTPTTPTSPSTTTITTSETAAAQPQGSVTYKQTAYTGGNSAVSFFAKTPVRIGLITAVAGSLLVTAYLATTGLRRRRYLQLAGASTAALPANPLAGGIHVGYDPTVIQPQSQPQQPNNSEKWQ